MTSAGILQVVVTYARDFKLRHACQRYNAYIIVYVGLQAYRAKLPPVGSRNPLWRETFQFYVTSESYLDIEIKDDCVFGAGGHVARTSIPLATVCKTGQDRICGPLPRQRSSGWERPLGAMSVSLTWTPCGVGNAALDRATTSPGDIMVPMGARSTPAATPRPRSASDPGTPRAGGSGDRKNPCDAGPSVREVAEPAKPSLSGAPLSAAVGDEGCAASLESSAASQTESPSEDNVFAGRLMHSAMRPVKAAISAERRAMRAVGRGLVRALMAPVEAARSVREGRSGERRREARALLGN